MTGGHGADRGHRAPQPAAAWLAHPAERLLLSLALLGFVLSTPPWPWAVPAALSATGGALFVRPAGTTRRQVVRGVLRWVLGPALFACAALVPSLWWAPLEGAGLLLRSLAATCTVGALVQSTPVIQIVGVLQQTNIAPTLVELMFLVHQATGITQRQFRLSQRTLSWRRPRTGGRQALADVGLIVHAVWRRSLRDVAQRDRALAWRTFGERPRLLPPPPLPWGRCVTGVAAIAVAAWAVRLLTGGAS